MFRTPMKFVTLHSLADVPDDAYPLIATPKYDGIRCVVQDGQAMSYQGKRIPNMYIRTQIEKYCKEGWDGEIVVDAKDGFGDVQSAVMSFDGEPRFRFMLLDVMPRPNGKDAGYNERRLPEIRILLPSFVLRAPVVVIRNYDALVKYENHIVIRGFEGIVLRNPNSLYKFGRATTRQHCWKYKRFSDAEAVVVGFEEMVSNEGKPKGTLGTIIGKRKDGGEVRVGGGKGMTAKMRQEIWNIRKAYMGKRFTYYFQKSGGKDGGKPRFGQFKCWRNI